MCQLSRSMCFVLEDGSVSYPITYGALEAAGNNYPTEYGYAQVDRGIFDGLSGMMVSARLLSAAIKITCSAPRDKLSGNFVACSTFVHRPGDMPIMTPGLQSGCTDFIQSSSEDGLVCVWNPQSNSDYDLTQLTSESNSGTHQKASQVFAIFGNGLPVGYSLEFEVIRNYEYVPSRYWTEILSPVSADKVANSGVNRALDAYYFSNHRAIVVNTVAGHEKVVREALALTKLK